MTADSKTKVKGLEKKNFRKKFDAIFGGNVYDAQIVLRDFIENNPFSVQILDENGHSLLENRSHKKLFEGKPPKGWSIYNDEQLTAQNLNRKFELLKFGKIVVVDYSTFNAHLVCSEFPDNLKIMRSITMPILDKDKKPVISIMMHEDITEKLNYQNELIALHDEFYERVDEEKKGVSEKLHDIVGQELVGIRNIIDNMTLYDLPEEVGKSINKAYHALNNLIDLVKDLTDKIRPPLPDKVSMSEATQWYIRDVAEKSEIIFESRIEKNIILSEKSTEKLYGILREGVGNALKYSKAKRIKIDLYREKNRIVLKIQDDGIGIEKGLAESNKSLGLRITKERVRTMGGKITIKGEKNKGTLLEIDLPLKNNV